ncbi:MAG: EamA family transporter, partial [Chloroflexi bacterium]|nr:EamA family transporter [Chloroflexota bacterium]
MTATALVLVLLSAVAHASWNFLLKRGHDQEAFVWWIQASIAVMFLPVAVVIAVVDPMESRGWLYVVGTGILHAFYFVLLGRGYARGDLSQVYPIARGTGPVLVPVLGVVLLDESISAQALTGIVAVIAGIFVVYWSGRLALLFSHPLMFLREPATLYAFATGLFIATYSVWDKVGVRHVAPFLYMYLMALGTGILLTPYMVRTRGLAAMRGEWTANSQLLATSKSGTVWKSRDQALDGGL